MKNRNYITIISAILLLFGQYAVAQVEDDIYFDGVEVKKEQIIAEEPVVKSNEYNRSDDEYVDEEYEFEYSARIRRFHQPARGFSYYSNYYVDCYWYDPYMPGVNIYVIQPYYVQYSWGWNYPYWGWAPYSYYGFGWNNYSGYYTYVGYGYSPYWGNPYWGNPYWGNPYWGGYNYAYWSGYSHGYWNGWYGSHHHHHHNNWYETSAPNAANFVTERYPRSSDAGLHRSRNTPVEGYDTRQRLNNNVNPNERINPDRTRDRNVQPNRDIRPNTDVRPNRDVRPPNRSVDPNRRPPNVRQPEQVIPERDRNIRVPERNNPPVIRQPEPIRPERDRNIRVPETKPPVMRERDPGRSGTLKPGRNIPPSSNRNSGSFNKSSNNRGGSIQRSPSPSGRSSGSFRSSGGSSGRSSGGRRGGG